MNAPARAIRIFDCVPTGAQLVMMDSDRHFPHLRAGEWAVVDTTDQAIVFDELYCVQQSNGRTIWCVVDDPHPEWRKEPEVPCAWLRPMTQQDVQAELDRADAEARHTGSTPTLNLYMSDGPIYLDYLQEQIIGRVIGVYQQEEMPLRITTSKLGPASRGALSSRPNARRAIYSP